MPSGIPVATVAINGGANAGILAAKILAVSDAELLAKLKEYSESLKNDVVKKMCIRDRSRTTEIQASFWEALSKTGTR